MDATKPKTEGGMELDELLPSYDSPLLDEIDDFVEYLDLMDCLELIELENQTP